jgi:hypothetical protein
MSRYVKINGRILKGVEEKTFCGQYTTIGDNIEHLFEDFFTTKSPVKSRESLSFKRDPYGKAEEFLRSLTTDSETSNKLIAYCISVNKNG